nr:MAG TPA_asm: hypothetical protein [Caudoviricetes sp.]
MHQDYAYKNSYIFYCVNKFILGFWFNPFLSGLTPFTSISIFKR